MRLTATQRWVRAQELGLWVDDQDKWLLYYYTWHLDDQGYPITTVGKRPSRRQSRLHSAIMGVPRLALGVIDHINRNPLDNRRVNLRYASYSVNNTNSTRTLNATNLKRNRNGSYSVSLFRDGDRYYLGSYADRQQAEQVRDEFLANYHKLPTVD